MCAASTICEEEVEREGREERRERYEAREKKNRRENREMLVSYTTVVNNGQ